MLYVGVDLAWGEGTPAKPANETGLCVIDAAGTVLDAGWARGIDAVAEWILRVTSSATGNSGPTGGGTSNTGETSNTGATGNETGGTSNSGPTGNETGATSSTGATGNETGGTSNSGPTGNGNTSASAPDAPGAAIAIDAPLVVPNATGMRESEKQVGRAYGRWKVSANASNQALAWLGGVTLRDRLESAGFLVVSGADDPAPSDRVMFECYPYTTLVGVDELGYDDERPRYKRLPRGVPPLVARADRAIATDDLLQRLRRLESFDPPLDLRTHPVTRRLLDEPTPLAGPAHKHREDLLDAALCAWTAALWHRHGTARVQILGRDEPRDHRGRPATIVAPARATQRLP